MLIINLGYCTSQKYTFTRETVTILNESVLGLFIFRAQSPLNAPFVSWALEEQSWNEGFSL